MDGATAAAAWTRTLPEPGSGRRAALNCHAAFTSQAHRTVRSFVLGYGEAHRIRIAGLVLIVRSIRPRTVVSSVPQILPVQ